MTLPKDALAQPISTGNVDILTTNEPLLGSEAKSTGHSRSASTPSLKTRPRPLNMSLRTFRFRALLDQTRAERAESLLGDTACS